MLLQTAPERPESFIEMLIFVNFNLEFVSYVSVFITYKSMLSRKCI